MQATLRLSNSVSVLTAIWTDGVILANREQVTQNGWPRCGKWTVTKNNVLCVSCSYSGEKQSKDGLQGSKYRLKFKCGQHKVTRTVTQRDLWVKGRQESLGEHIPTEVVAGVKAPETEPGRRHHGEWKKRGGGCREARGAYILPSAFAWLIKREACWRVLKRAGSTICLFLWLDPLSRLSEWSKNEPGLPE